MTNGNSFTRGGAKRRVTSAVAAFAGLSLLMTGCAAGADGPDDDDTTQTSTEGTTSAVPEKDTDKDKTPKPSATEDKNDADADAPAAPGTGGVTPITDGDSYTPVTVPGASGSSSVGDGTGATVAPIPGTNDGGSNAGGGTTVVVDNDTTDNNDTVDTGNGGGNGGNTGGNEGGAGNGGNSGGGNDGGSNSGGGDTGNGGGGNEGGNSGGGNDGGNDGDDNTEEPAPEAPTAASAVADLIADGKLSESDTTFSEMADFIKTYNENLVSEGFEPLPASHFLFYLNETPGEGASQQIEDKAQEYADAEDDSQVKPHENLPGNVQYQGNNMIPDSQGTSAANGWLASESHKKLIYIDHYDEKNEKGGYIVVSFATVEDGQVFDKPKYTTIGAAEVITKEKFEEGRYNAETGEGIYVQYTELENLANGTYESAPAAPVEDETPVVEDEAPAAPVEDEAAPVEAEPEYVEPEYEAETYAATETYEAPVEEYVEAEAYETEYIEPEYVEPETTYEVEVYEETESVDTGLELSGTGGEIDEISLAPELDEAAE